MGDVVKFPPRKEPCDHDYDMPYMGYVECKRCCHTLPLLALVAGKKDA